jgi:predicted O-methyltransferase YrrM
MKGCLINERWATIKSELLSVIGPARAGRLDYLLRPSLRAGFFGLPMNGQIGRIEMFREIVKSLPLQAIVETGTFRGATTKFLAEFGIPVYTVEAEPRYHAFAELKLRSLRNRVHLTLGDSRSFLRQLASDAAFPKDSVLFYLDAHWNADLPLAKEIDTVFTSWRRSIIVVDDFAVPGDSYSYDDYGPGAVLNAEYLDGIGRTDMIRFYPSLPAYQETGMRRGCIVLCNDPETRDRLSELRSLRPA